MFSIIICAFILLGFTLLTGYNLGVLSQSNLFNYFFLALMTGLLLPFTASFMRKANSLTESLNSAENTVNNWRNHKFSDYYLNSLYQKFLIKKENSSEKSVDCDISDYINISVLNSIINKPVCDIVSATLTGLGLLGTFVGLIWGLNDFNTDYENMQTSIANLLSGIRTAFMTSIYGVVFSLVFNWKYKNNYSRMKASLDSYHKAFYQIADNSAEYNTNKQVVDNGKQLLNTLNALSNNISSNFDTSISKMTTNVNNVLNNIYQSIGSALFNQENNLNNSMSKLERSIETSLNKMNDSFSTTLSHQENSMRESMNNMSGIIKESVSLINKSVVNALDNQENSLKSMVKTYVDESSKKLNKELKDVKDSFENISKSNNDYCDKINILTASLTESTSSFSEVVDGFVSYLNDISEYQSKITDANTHLEENMKALTVRYDTQSEDVKLLSNHIINLNNTVDAMTGLTSELKNLVKESEENRITYMKNASELVDNIRNSSLEVNSNAIKASEMCNKLADDISNYSMANMQESIEALEKLSNEFRIASESIGNDYKKLSYDLQKGITCSFKEFDSETADIIQRFSDILVDIKGSADYIPERLNQAVEYEFEKQRRKYEKLKSDYNDESICSSDKNTNIKEMIKSEMEINENMENEIVYDEDNDTFDEDEYI